MTEVELCWSVGTCMAVGASDGIGRDCASRRRQRPERRAARPAATAFDRMRATGIVSGMNDSMRAVQATAFSIDALRLASRAVPQPRRGEVLVQLRAASLNHRDLSFLTEN